MLTKENIQKIIYLFFVLTIIPLLIFYGGKKGILLLCLFSAFLPLVLTFKDSFLFLELSFLVFALSPFYIGIDFGGKIPKIYITEIFFLIYFIYFILIYFLFKIKNFSFQKEIFFVFLILIIFQSISFFNNETDYVKIRNFFETYVFGIFLFVIFYNEITEKNYEKFINIIIWVTTIISIFVLIEYFFKYNPILSFAKKLNFFYISPEVAERLNAFYRPYAMFSSPSTLGTFLAMSFPFFIYNIKNRNKWYILLLIITLAAVILNYTRGVWVALFLSTMLYYKRLRKLIPFFLIIGILVYYISFKYLIDYPFFKRLTDPKNLVIRMAYWKIAIEILKEKFLYGIGHLNFKDHYLYYIEKSPFSFNFNFKEIYVADNIFLTTIVEHGILGLFSILLLFYYFFKNLLKCSKKILYINNKYTDFLKICAFSLTIYVIAGFFADVHLFIRITKYFFIIAGSGFGVAKLCRNTFK